MDSKEVAEFMKVLSNLELLKNLLLNRIITNVINDIPEIISRMASRNLDYISALGTLKSIADNYLSEQEANQFTRKALLRRPANKPVCCGISCADLPVIKGRYDSLWEGI